MTLWSMHRALNRSSVTRCSQITQEVSADRGTTTYAYDPAGNLVSRINARGIEEQRSYHAASRVLSIRYLDNDTTAWRQLDYQWNNLGQLARLAASGADTDFSYDALGRISATATQVAGPAMSVGYTYNSAGQLASIQYPSGRSLSIGYDSAGRIASLAMVPYQIVSNVSYHPFGPVKSIELLNGIVHTRALDTNGLPSRVTLGGIVTDYGYDLAGRITSLDVDGGTAYDQSFGYDAADRITSYTGHPGTRGFTYDANGNRSSQTIAGMVTSIVMQAGSNRISRLGNRPYSHEATGNVAYNGVAKLAYEVDGALKAVYPSGGAVNYLYDGFGRRAAKVWPDRSPVERIKYAYDTADHLIGEYKQDGTPIREYIWLGELPVAVIDTHTDGTTTAYAIETDHLGTPRLLTDATQQARWRWTSPPFGDVPPDDDPTGLAPVSFNLRFPGQYYDKESGLSYNWHRYYDAETGRYVQSDPIGLDGGWNTYSYVGGNPLRYVDPTGLCKITTNGPIVVIDCRPPPPAPFLGPPESPPPTIEWPHFRFPRFFPNWMKSAEQCEQEKQQCEDNCYRAYEGVIRQICGKLRSPNKRRICIENANIEHGECRADCARKHAK